MLYLFKGQLSLNDMKNMPYKELIMLREARINRLKAENEQAKSGGKNAQSALAMKRFEEHLEENM
jgi:hypothetical protein